MAKRTIADAATESSGVACCASVLAAPLDEFDAERIARRFAALADPVRLRLLSLIAATDEICSCDLLEPVDRSQPTVSHHTKLLAEAGLIERPGAAVEEAEQEAAAARN